MTRVLVDTPALIWFAEGSTALSDHARSLIDDPSVTQLASAASLWEMAIKTGSGKLTLRVGSLSLFANMLATNDIAVLPILPEDAVAVGTLPTIANHKDPFDRMIAAQCLRHDFTLISTDFAFDAYGV